MKNDEILKDRGKKGRIYGIESELKNYTNDSVNSEGIWPDQVRNEDYLLTIIPFVDRSYSFTTSLFSPRSIPPIPSYYLTKTWP